MVTSLHPVRNCAAVTCVVRKARVRIVIQCCTAQATLRWTFTGDTSYNAHMHRLKRWLPQSLTLACLAFVLVSLSPNSPSYAHDEARLHSVRVQAHVEQVLFEGPSPIDLSIAVLSPRPWQYQPLQPGRGSVATHFTQFIDSPATCSFTPTPDSLPMIPWWKHRRYACQMLDTPPPLCVPARTL